MPFAYIKLRYHTENIFQILGLLAVERTTSLLHKYRCYRPLRSFQSSYELLYL